MSECKTCSRCGATLAAGEELCSRCLLALGRAQATSSSDGQSRDATGRVKKCPTPLLEEIAARFPELEVIALIGEGGMGAVYKARQTKIDRFVALKVLGFDPIDHPTFAERFRREARVLARLDHPNVVKLFDFGERDGLFFLVLEFVDGTNLRALLNAGVLEPRQAIAIVPQICEALQFAHDEGVVHRDIKPENVLIDTKGRVKITDFGLAKLVKADAREVALTDAGQVMGTPHYMAPEQLRGDSDVDHRADIYSLGVVFYEMLTGELPRGNFELPSKHIHVDVMLDEIVLKSLERTPERRYQHAIEVKTDVESVSGASNKPLHDLAGRASLEGGTETRSREVKVSHQPGWIALNRPWCYFVTLLCLWPLVGWGFNQGVGWFVTATALIAAAFWSLLQREIDAQPRLADALKSEARDVIFARHLTALILLTLGFVMLSLGHIGVFDHCASNYRSGPSDPESMRALESQLLPELESRMSLTWPVDRGRLQFTRQFSGASDREMLYHQPWLLFLAVALCIATAAVLGSRWADLRSWRGWRVPVRATGSLFGSLLLLHAACALFASIRGEVGPLMHVPDPGAGVGWPHGTEKLAGEVRIALLERNYRVTAEGAWSYTEPDAPSTPRQLQIYFADPESPFERWHLSWLGPRRVQPHAVLVMRGPRADGTANLRCDLGDAPPDSPEQREWSDRFANLLPAAQ